MADDLELDLEDDKEDIKRKDKRLTDLSEKVKLTSKERDDLAELNKTIAAEKEAAIKERDFYQSFADSASQYPQAKDHKDEIKSKVLSGYTVEDATISVLAKAGKLVPPKVERETSAGGSAINPPPRDGVKSLHEMTRDEKRQALIEAVNRGDISMS